MEKSIRILIAEDSDEHFELLLRELKAQKIECSHRRAQTKAEFLKGLQEFKPDLVISDYRLPQLDSMTAFRMTRDFDTTLPFIIITGSMDEETAVECMKVGVTDYVIKEHMERIGPAVRAAIHRKWALSLLLETEIQHQKLVDSINGIVWRLDFATSRFKYVSRRAKAILGYEPELWMSEPDFWKNHIHPEDREWAVDFCVTAAKAKRDYEFEYRMIDADGRTVWIQDVVSVVEGADGSTELIGVMLDVTPAKRGEEALKLSEERLTAMIESAPDPIVVLTSLGFIQSVNPETERLSGHPRDEIVGKHFTRTNALSPKSLLTAIGEFSVLMAGHEHPPFELEFVRKDGQMLIFEANARVIRKRGKPAGLQIILRDQTKRRRAEAALRESEEKFRTLTSHAPVGIYFTDVKGDCLFVNERWCEITGLTLEQAKGKGWTAALHAEDRERVCKEWYAITEGKKFYSEYRFMSPQKKMTWVSGSAVPLHDNAGQTVGYLGTVMDVTERRQLEEQLRQSQKMEAVGQLAGGIAHDFNNILTAITGYTELALKSETSESVHADLEEVYKAAERASGLTRQLLSFSRRQAVNARIIELNELIRNMDKMLRRIIGEDIEFSIRTGKGVKPVKADSGQIEQVIMNLAVNARDAVAAGGRVDIETSFARVEEAFALRHEGGKPGEYVLFGVRDTGHGMSEDVKKHLFEPFFTTKEAGKGTGLGLATCYGIVKQAGGFIDVQSETGKGTAVTVYLPVAEGPEEARPQEKPRDGAMPKGTEKAREVLDKQEARP